MTRAKLTAKQLKHIYWMLDYGTSQREIARHYGVSQPVISKIKRERKRKE